MILFSVGLPGRFAEWCDAVITRLARRVLGEVQAVSLNTLEELALAMIRSDAAHFMVCSRQPGGGVQTALAQTGKRFVAVLDEPRLALQDLAMRHGYDLVNATRAVACSCASMLHCASVPGALVLGSHDDRRDPIVTATAIARHLGLDVAAADVDEIVRVLEDEGVAPTRSEASNWWADLREQDVTLVNGALGAYVDQFGGGEFGKITWERDLFFIFEEPAKELPLPATRAVDITGRNRCLVYGPFINLPPGSWSARIVLGLSSQAARMTYILEVFAGTQLTHVSIQPGNERVVEATLDFSIDASVNHPVQIRVYTQRAAFDGRLAVGYVTLTPRANIRSDASAYLATVLSN